MKLPYGIPGMVMAIQTIVARSGNRMAFEGRRTASCVPLLAMYHSGYASVARLDERTLAVLHPICEKDHTGEYPDRCPNGL